MTELDRMISGFEKGIQGHANCAANLIGLAEVVAEKKEKLRAFELARKAIAAGCDDPAIVNRARALLSTLVPGYHVPMMNDTRRNDAWSRALRRAVRPGAHALEIGTGAGMLALMAARAGAERITTCERNPIMAVIAQEIATRNGYDARIRVIGKRSQDLIPGVDIERPADLLFCDIFADNLVGLDALPALSDARRRLLAPGAKVVPAAGAVRIALADWAGYERFCKIGRVEGFDLTPFSAFVPAASRLEIGSSRLRLLSPDTEPFRFDFAAPAQAEAGRTEVILTAACDAVINGIVQWIRLELDSEVVLEARPEPGAEFFSSPWFHPFPEPLSLRGGDRLRVVAEYRGKRLAIRLAGRLRE